MKKLSSSAMTNRVGDAALAAKTGKTWPEWFAVLDAAGAAKLSHKEIVALLHGRHNVGPWWGQMVTVGYEQTRGLREEHQKPDGYEISRSKTFNVPVQVLFGSWLDTKSRDRWLGVKGLVIRKATEFKSIRITWPEGPTSIELGFYPKGAEKAQVAVQHSKIPNAKKADQMKAYWGEALERLAVFLEKEALPAKAEVSSKAKPSRKPARAKISKK